MSDSVAISYSFSVLLPVIHVKRMILQLIKFTKATHNTSLQKQ